MVFPVDKFASQDTPFYYYDTNLLKETLDAVNKASSRHEAACVHYAVKANTNPSLLALIAGAGLGADCVSGGEIYAALSAGIPPHKIFYAGVGKTDREIELGVEKEIGCFNVESLPELEVINSIAEAKGKTANVAVRVNPDVDANTHAGITTGLNENKFGIPLSMLGDVVQRCLQMKHVRFMGLHFHIGSQVLDMDTFKPLCFRINEILRDFRSKGIEVKIVNVGGGLGVDYTAPDTNPIPAFADYFDVYFNNIELAPGQELHFELGRSVVAQCGTLVSRVLYIKEGVEKTFAILDAGMTDLIRPALYGAYHKVENISSQGVLSVMKYDVVGPVCESSDVFGKNLEIEQLKRGDLVAIRSAGAYGEVMASSYNSRRLPRVVLSTDF